MRKKNLWSMLTIIMITMLTVGFVSCGGDDDDDDNKKEDNSDLIGWWKEPDSNWTYDAMGWDYSSSRHALHFINANTVEEAWVVKKEQVSSNDFYGRDSWKDAFSGWYYFTGFDHYTWVYERKDNVITLQRSTENNNNNIVIIDNKLRWGAYEYVKVTNQ